MTTNQQIKEARLELLRSNATIATVIQELVRELERMQENKLASGLLDKKDAQIDKLINYYNQVTDLVQFYHLLTLNQQIELQQAWLIIDGIRENKNNAHEALLQYCRKA
jgi:hypothetical protein